MDLELSEASPYKGMIFMGSYTKKDTIIIFNNEWTDPMDYYPLCGCSYNNSMDLVNFVTEGISWESLLIALHDVGEGFSTLLDMLCMHNKDAYLVFFDRDQINKDQE